MVKFFQICGFLALMFSLSVSAAAFTITPEEASLGYFTDRLEFKADPVDVRFFNGIRSVHFKDDENPGPEITLLNSIEGAEIDGVGYVPIGQLNLSDVHIDNDVLITLVMHNVAELRHRIRNVSYDYPPQRAMNEYGEVYWSDPNSFFVVQLRQKDDNHVQTLKTDLEASTQLNLYESYFPIPADIEPEQPICSEYGAWDDSTSESWQLSASGINAFACYDDICWSMNYSTKIVAMIDAAYGPESDCHFDLWNNIHPLSELSPWTCDDILDNFPDMDEYNTVYYMHGLWVAGVISSIAGNIMPENVYSKPEPSSGGWGLYGVAPHTQLLALNFIDSTDYIEDYWTLIGHLNAGIEIRALNTSWGIRSTTYQPLLESIDALFLDGVGQYASAGNYGPLDPAHVGLPAYSPMVYSIGASDIDENVADFSNWKNHNFVAAPGVDILTTGWRCVEKPCNPYYPNVFYRLSGTSFSSPLMAGASALLGNAYSDLSVHTIADIISRSTIRQQENGIATEPFDGLWWDSLWGYGLPDLEYAAQWLDEGPPWGKAPFYGDANNDGYCNAGDVLSLTWWIFYDSAAVDPVYSDANHDGTIDVVDAVYLMHYLYRGGPPPVQRGSAAVSDKPLELNNHPNPFNPSTTISFRIPSETDWTIKIFNVIGQSVRNFSGHSLPGSVEVVWDGNDNTGNAVASGIYFYRLETGQISQTRKMVLIK